VVELEPGNKLAAKKLGELGAQAEEKREKLKAEMLGAWLQPGRDAEHA
jgi:hypothetical protein